MHNDGYGRISIKINGDYDSDVPVQLTLSSADGSYSHTWADAAEFPSYENFLIGEYSVTAVQGVPESEGYHCPCLSASTRFTVTNENVSEVSLDLVLAQAVYYAECSDLSDEFTLRAVTLHSPGRGYVSVDLLSDEPLYIMPGATMVFATIADSEGREVTLLLTDHLMASAGRSAYIHISVNDGRIGLDCDNVNVSLPLTPEIWQSGEPKITCSGFEDSETLILIEGFPHDKALSMKVDAPAGISSLTLTGLTEFPLPDGLPSEMNVLKNIDLLESYGLKITLPSESEAVVDFTDLLENISVSRDTRLTFLMICTDKLGRVSQPCILNVDIHRVSVENVDVADAVLGIDKSTIAMRVNVDDVQIADFNVLVGDNDSETKFTGKFDADNKLVVIDFEVPEGVNDVPVSIYYLGQKRLEAVVHRSVPEFSLIADAFATFAIIHVDAPDQSSAQAITRYIEIASNVGSIYSRNPEESNFTVSVLNPATQYAIPCHVISSRFSSYARFTTERALEVPDGDFEDANPFIEYKGLKSGGVYSATEFPIFNMQNYSDINIWWPKKYWASLNAKTFCKDADNHNTWFLQPSTVIDFSQSASGSKSMRISSVGWSLDGDEIVPSVQSGATYQPYNPNIPFIDHISAGRLFLGSYSFNPGNMSESYILGVNFTSRPTSLNGFYRYIPDANRLDERGVVEVELVNDTGEAETIVARGSMTLDPAQDFKSFNLPLEFLCYNIKPTRLRMMFCSSAYSDWPEKDDTAVPVSPHPEVAAFIGSELWIDNLSFSY